MYLYIYIYIISKFTTGTAKKSPERTGDFTRCQAKQLNQAWEKSVAVGRVWCFKAAIDSDTSSV